MLGVAALISLASAALAAPPVGEGVFRAPLTLVNAGRPGPAMVQAGDLDGDGKLDLVTANGSPGIITYLQGASRAEWLQRPVRVGALVWFARAADFDGDGLDDVVASDISSTAYFLLSTGKGEFAAPKPIAGSNGARWSAIGDWNNDGDLDLATANISNANLTVFLGDGKGRFALKQDLPGSREHTLEALDFDGDGVLDLMLGTGLDGLTPHKGVGDGTFIPGQRFDDLGCAEYLTEMGHIEKGKYVLTGDLNGDGKADISSTCIETASAAAAVSIGDGTFRKVFLDAAGADVDSTAIADLDGDGKADLAIASRGSTSIQVWRGKGDGDFQPEPVAFEPTGDTPVFLLSRDIDGDGLADLVSADQGSSTLTLFWGRKGDRFLESGFGLRGHPTARAMAAADIDGDGAPDLLFASAERPEVQVYLGPGVGFPAAPSMVVKTKDRYGLLEAADLDGDGVPDLVGADPAAGNFLAALLDRSGNARGELAMPAGIQPSAIAVGQLDGSGALDVAVACRGSSQVALFLGQGNGKFDDARKLDTIQRAKAIAIARIDDDALEDLVLVSDTQVAVHYGDGGGGFGEAREVLGDPAKLFTDVAVGDLDGDGKADIAVCETRTGAVLVFRGKGDRTFDAPVTLRTAGPPATITLADLDGNGLLDIAAVSTTSRSVSVLLGLPDRTFQGPFVYGLGIPVSAHLLLDLDGDGALDLAAFAPASAEVLFGRWTAPPAARFIRGDASGDGKVDLNDAVRILDRLFLGGTPLLCDAAGDADGDGALSLNDAIAMLSRLFLGGEPLPPPGPVCGPDPAPSGLSCETGCGP